MAGYKGKLQSGYGTGGDGRARGSKTAKEDMERAGAGMAKAARGINRAPKPAKKAIRTPKTGLPSGGTGSYRK